MKRKWLSLLLVLALLLGMMPAAVFATDGVLEIAMDDLTLIGARDSGFGDPDEVYVFDDADLTGITALDFSPIVGEDDEFDGFIMPLGNNYALYTDSCIVEDYADYIIDADYFTDENFEAEDEWENIDFSEYLGFYVYYDEGILNVLIPKPVGIFNEYGFILSVGEVTDVEEDGCTIASWDGTSSDVDLLTVTVPFGTEAVEFTFEEARLAYGYGDPSDYDSYLCACAPTEDGAYADINAGETSAVVKMQENYQLPPYVFVQTPYDENGSSTTLFAVTFEYSYTFTAKVDGTACEIVKVEPGAYEYNDYMTGQTCHVPIYTVAVPYGTENVDIALSDPGLLYNYDGAGTWLAGWYTDTMTTGQTEFNVAIDSDGDGAVDYIQVQKYYNENYTGGDLYYAITFEEDIPPTASVRIIGPGNHEIVPYETATLEEGMTLKGLLEKVLTPIGLTVEWSGGFVTSISSFPLDEDDYWMTMLNDSEEALYSGTCETIEAQAGDRLVLFAGSNGRYGWMTAHENDGYPPMEDDGTTWITRQATFHVQGYSWYDGTFDVDGADVLVTGENGEELPAYSYAFYENNYATEAQTGEDGRIGIEFYGSCPTEDLDEFERVFEVRAVKGGEKSISTAFCLVTLTADGITFSQPDEEVPAPVIEHKEDIEEDVQALLDALLAPDETKPETAYGNDWALAMKAAGKTPTEAELTAFKKNALAAARGGSLTPAQKAKWAIALSALGIDATQIPAEDGSPIDLVAEVYNTTEEEILDQFSPDAYQAPFIVDLYKLGMYDIPEDAALTEDFLVDLMLDGQGEDGSWYGEYGADGTGMVLPGLEVVMDREGVSAAILNAFEYLSEAQSDDGSFGNIWSTVMVSMGLHAIGADTHMGEAFLKDDCAIGNILAQAETLTASGANPQLQAQAAWALATYQNIEGNRNQNLYHFDGTVSVCTDWPDADLLTGIAVTTLPDKTVYEIGETFDPAGLVVTATYNADPENTEVIEEGYTLSEPDMTTAGNKTVTVTYQGQTATFVITVRSAGGGDAGEYAYITVKGLDETFVAKTKEDIVAGETTALELLKSVLGREGIPYVIKNGGTYVASINGLAEFDEGPNSGWLYKVNGSLPGSGTMAASEYCLQNGDNLVWFYTKDYTQEDVVKPTLPSEQENTQKFIDVTEADWYDEYANKAAELGLFAGYEAGTDADGNKLYEFRGTETMTRAMFVTVLRAMETKLHGEPAEAPSADFDDVKAGDWFEKGVNWAFEKGITAGKGEVFGVDDPVTREQMAVFVYLYAKQAGLVKGEPNLSKLDAFTDAGDISDYAKEAIAWLVGEGLMAGRGEGKLAPKASSTRAEVAAFMVSCCEYFAK